MGYFHKLAFYNCQFIIEHLKLTEKKILQGIPQKRTPTIESIFVRVWHIEDFPPTFLTICSKGIIDL